MRCLGGSHEQKLEIGGDAHAIYELRDDDHDEHDDAVANVAAAASVTSAISSFNHPHDRRPRSSHGAVEVASSPSGCRPTPGAMQTAPIYRKSVQ